MMRRLSSSSFFFFNDTATTEIYTLSLHDALPILNRTTGRRVMRSPHCPHMRGGEPPGAVIETAIRLDHRSGRFTDRKSTRLNSSHTVISYAVFCLKKKKKNNKSITAGRRLVAECD